MKFDVLHPRTKCIDFLTFFNVIPSNHLYQFSQMILPFYKHHLRLKKTTAIRFIFWQKLRDEMEVV